MNTLLVDVCSLSTNRKNNNRKSFEIRKTDHLQLVSTEAFHKPQRTNRGIIYRTFYQTRLTKKVRKRDVEKLDPVDNNDNTQTAYPHTLRQTVIWMANTMQYSKGNLALLVANL